MAPFTLLFYCLFAFTLSSVVHADAVEPLSDVCDNRRATSREIWASLQAAAADCPCSGNCCCDVQAAVSAYDTANRPYGDRIDDVCDCLLSSSEEVAGGWAADWGVVAGGTFGADVADCDVASCIEEVLQGLIDRVDVAEDDDDEYSELAILTAFPTSAPTAALPTMSPTPAPSATPSLAPTPAPSVLSTESPTAAPTLSPTSVPSTAPTASPTLLPTIAPTASPTVLPTIAPTTAPTAAPTGFPTLMPSPAPTSSPTVSPTFSPTRSPTRSPTFAPTLSPSMTPTAAPTQSPTQSPTFSPTLSPTSKPTSLPTFSPTTAPTVAPSHAPTAAPTAVPTVAPTVAPSATPTASPTEAPTFSPTVSPTTAPTAAPTPAPTVEPIDLGRVEALCNNSVLSFCPLCAGCVCSSIGEANFPVFSASEVTIGSLGTPGEPQCVGIYGNGGSMELTPSNVSSLCLLVLATLTDDLTVDASLAENGACVALDASSSVAGTLAVGSSTAPSLVLALNGADVGAVELAGPDVGVLLFPDPTAAPPDVGSIIGDVNCSQATLSCSLLIQGEANASAVLGGVTPPDVGATFVVSLANTHVLDDLVYSSDSTSSVASITTSDVYGTISGFYVTIVQQSTVVSDVIALSPGSVVQLSSSQVRSVSGATVVLADSGIDGDVVCTQTGSVVRSNITGSFTSGTASSLVESTVGSSIFVNPADNSLPSAFQASSLVATGPLYIGGNASVLAVVLIDTSLGPNEEGVAVIVEEFASNIPTASLSLLRSDVVGDVDIGSIPATQMGLTNTTLDGSVFAPSLSSTFVCSGSYLAGRTVLGSGPTSLTIASCTLNGSSTFPLPTLVRGSGTQITSILQSHIIGDIDLGEGNNTVLVAMAEFEGSLITGAGSDTVTFSSLSYPFMGSVSLGPGDDSFTALTFDIGQEARIDMGSGDDSVSLGSSVIVQGTIDVGTGLDTILFQNDFTGDLICTVDTTCWYNNVTGPDTPTIIGNCTCDAL